MKTLYLSLSLALSRSCTSESMLVPSACCCLCSSRRASFSCRRAATLCLRASHSSTYRPGPETTRTFGFTLLLWSFVVTNEYVQHVNLLSVDVFLLVRIQVGLLQLNSCALCSITNTILDSRKGTTRFKNLHFIFIFLFMGVIFPPDLSILGFINLNTTLSDSKPQNTVEKGINSKKARQTIIKKKCKTKQKWEPLTS